MAFGIIFQLPFLQEKWHSLEDGYVGKIRGIRLLNLALEIGSIKQFWSRHVDMDDFFMEKILQYKNFYENVKNQTDTEGP